MSEKQQLLSYLNSDIFSFYLFFFFCLATSRHIHSFRTVCPAVVLQSYSTYWLLVFKLHFLNLLNSHRPNSATLLSDIVSHVIRCLLNCVNHTSRNQQPVSQKHNSLHMHLFLDLPNTQCENCIQSLLPFSVSKPLTSSVYYTVFLAPNRKPSHQVTEEMQNRNPRGSEIAKLLWDILCYMQIHSCNTTGGLGSSATRVFSRLQFGGTEEDKRNEGEKTKEAYEFLSARKRWRAALK